MHRNKASRKANKRATDIRERRDVRGKFYPRILIVCEGEKTEPFYFEALRGFYKLSRDSVEIAGIGANPTSIVKIAEEKYKASKRDGVTFDKVFCVFDKDSHADYHRALAQLKNKENFEAIVSVPCFEYWLLMHYHGNTKPYQKAGNKSACDQVISDLTKHIPHYRKGERSVFGYVEKELATAITNAKNTLKAAQKSGTDNPSTKVHLLVEYLQNISRPPRR